MCTCLVGFFFLSFSSDNLHPRCRPSVSQEISRQVSERDDCGYFAYSDRSIMRQLDGVGDCMDGANGDEMEWSVLAC